MILFGPGTVDLVTARNHETGVKDHTSHIHGILFTMIAYGG